MGEREERGREEKGRRAGVVVSLLLKRTEIFFSLSEGGG